MTDWYVIELRPYLVDLATGLFKSFDQFRIVADDFCEKNNNNLIFLYLPVWVVF